ncbi:MAG: hypothetical protein QME07_05270 [bacterium]|nr:hypothetical protein [bacterium]
MNLKELNPIIKKIDPFCLKGRVKQVIGLVIESEGPPASVGEICLISPGKKEIQAEVVGFRDKNLCLMPIGSTEGIKADDEVIATGKPLMVGVGEGLIGRVLNGVGQPIDGKGLLLSETKYPILRDSPDPLKRPRINKCLNL